MHLARSKTYPFLLRSLFLLGGMVLFVHLVQRVGLHQLLEEFDEIGWGLLPFVCIHAAKEALSTFSWRATFPIPCNSCSWWQLYFINWAGAAVDKVYPTGMVGGETLKVAMVRKQASTRQGIASVLIAKLAEGSAQAIFISTGIFFLLHQVKFPQPLQNALLAGSVLLLLGVILFWVLQTKGLVGSILKVLERMSFPARLLVKMQDKTTALDELIRTYHSRHFRLFWAAVVLQLIRQLLDLAQIQWVLYLMDTPGGFQRCFFISLFSSLVNAVFIFIPGRIGVQEGGKIVIARALGMTTAEGLTLGLVSRMNQIIWTLLGLVCLFLWQGKLQGHALQNLQGAQRTE